MWALLAFLAVLAIFVWACLESLKEAERKLGRELTVVELVFAALTMPYSLIYVLWFLEEPKEK